MTFEENKVDGWECGSVIGDWETEPNPAMQGATKSRKEVVAEKSMPLETVDDFVGLVESRFSVCGTVNLGVLDFVDKRLQADTYELTGKDDKDVLNDMKLIFQGKLEDGFNTIWWRVLPKITECGFSRKKLRLRVFFDRD